MTRIDSTIPFPPLRHCTTCNVVRIPMSSSIAWLASPSLMSTDMMYGKPLIAGLVPVIVIISPRWRASSASTAQALFILNMIDHRCDLTLRGQVFSIIAFVVVSSTTILSSDSRFRSPVLFIACRTTGIMELVPGFSEFPLEDECSPATS